MASCWAFLHEDIFKSVSYQDRVKHCRTSITSNETKEFEVKQEEGERLGSPGVGSDDSSEPSVTLSLWWFGARAEVSWQAPPPPLLKSPAHRSQSRK